MITFKDLEIEGFGVFRDPTTFSLDRPGISILSLRNGRGKSTIFGALVWALYGKPLKSGSTIPTYEHLRHEGWAGTKVSITFTKGKDRYKVVRCMDWTGKINGEKGRNKAFVYINSAPYDNIRSKAETNNFITSILGYSYELFINTVVFPQKSQRFIEERGADKRKIFEEVFDLHWIGETSKLAKSKRAQVQTEHTTQNLALTKIQAEVDSLEQFLSRVEESRKSFEEEKARTIDELKQTLSQDLDSTPKDPNSLEDQLGTLTEKLKALKEGFDAQQLDRVSTRYQRAVALKDQAITSIAEAQQRIKEYSKSTNSKCPTCDQLLPDLTRRTLLEAATLEASNLQAQLKESEKLSLSLGLELKGLKAKRRSIQEVEQGLNRVNSELRVIYSYNESIHQQVSNRASILTQIEVEEKREFKDISPELTKKKEIKEVEEDKLFLTVRSLERKMALYDWAIKTPLSESGVKSFLIDRMIKLLNQSLESYQEQIGFRVQLMVDTEKARKDIHTLVYRGDFPVLLEDLSGGERQLVNVTVALALTDLLKSLATGNQTNLQIFDEVFESLDSTNVEIISDLLQSLYTGNQTILIVTHKKDFVIRNANKIIL